MPEIKIPIPNIETGIEFSLLYYPGGRKIYFQFATYRQNMVYCYCKIFIQCVTVLLLSNIKYVLKSEYKKYERSQAMSGMQVVLFKINEGLYGADVLAVHEIVKYQGVEKIYGMPDFMDGILNLRGKMIPVVNLGKKLGLKPVEATKKTKIIIIKKDNFPVGLAVSDVVDIIRLSEDELENVPRILGEIDKNRIKIIGKMEKDLLVVFDPENFLTEDEIETISELISEPEVTR